jgi:hypothetical protein
MLVSLNCVNKLVFVMDTQHSSYEEGTEFAVERITHRCVRSYKYRLLFVLQSMKQRGCEPQI